MEDAPDVSTGYGRADVGSCPASVSPPAGAGGSAESRVAPNDTWLSPGTIRTRVDCPDPAPAGRNAWGAIPVCPITLRIPASRETPRDETATRPNETSTSAPTAGSPSANAFARNATLLPGCSTTSDRSELRIGARFGVSRTTSNTASSANGFITTM